MKKEEIHFGDLNRWLFGSAPPEFMIEVLIRTLCIYLLLLLAVRLMGKRMAAQLSLLELAALVSLAAAVGVPILSYDRGILPAFIIAATIVCITRGIAWWSSRNEHFEQVTHGDVDLLVEDASMNLDVMKRTRITRDRLFSQLREAQIYHLGQVKRLYLEANGSFTLVKEQDQQPGLIVLPDWDQDFIRQGLLPSEATVCGNCGWKPAAGSREVPCDKCGEQEWTKAVTQHAASGN